MQRLPPPENLTCSFANADLNSASATRTPTFTFPPLEPPTIQGPPPGPSTRLRTDHDDHHHPITLLHCSNPAQTCLRIKDWLLKSFSQPTTFAPGILRMEGLELHLLDTGGPGGGKRAGWMLVCERIARLDGPGDKERAEVMIIAILVPGDAKVRWFYSLLPFGTLLRTLQEKDVVRMAKEFTVGTRGWRKLFTWVRSEFVTAVTLPHSPDYINALSLTDCCPPILDPDSALARLESNEFLHDSHRRAEDAGRDLSDDRYLLGLHPAEREAVSVSGLKCAEYLLVKRDFFKSFFEEVYRSDKKIEAHTSTTGTAVGTPARGRGGRFATPTPAPSTAGTPTPGPTPASVSRAVRERTQTQTPGRRGVAKPSRRQRVRTDHAHQQWLEKVYDFKVSRAKVLVTAWRELGFLDEARYLPWVKAGGVFESIGSEEAEEVE